MSGPPNRDPPPLAEQFNPCQTTQLTVGGRKRTASYFQLWPRCLSPRMYFTSVWSALAQLLALSASAHARSSWTRI